MQQTNVEIVLEPLAGHTRYAPVAVIGYWLRQTNFLAPVWSELNWPIKTYVHTPVAKLETLLASILVGNRAVYQINTTIRPDLPLARAWGQARFAEQSTVAEMLNNVGDAEVAQLQQGGAALLQLHSRALRHDFDSHWLLVDYDTTGLLISKAAEGSEKGYFTGHRNRYGRQLVRITVPTYHETLASHLFPGSRRAFTTVKEAFGAFEQRLPLSRQKRQRTIVRSDAGIGTDANINWLLWRGYQVLMKGFSHTRAASQAKKIAPDAWIPDPDQKRWIAVSVAPPRFGRRADVYVLRWSTQQSLRRGTLINTVPGLSPLGAWRLCDGRGAAEVEIRADKQGLKLPKRRKRKMAAQMVLILMTDIAHNLLAWLHAATMADGPFADFGTLRVVEDLLTIPGRLEFKGAALHKVALLETHPFADHMRMVLEELLTKSTIP